MGSGAVIDRVRAQEYSVGRRLAMTGQAVFPFGPSPVGRTSRGRSTAGLAPRVSPAALRVPDPIHAQVEIAFPAGYPQIFVHEGARQALERRLTQAHRRPVSLAVTDNRRNMISHSNREGMMRARIHHMFLDAPGAVQNALIQYVVRGDRGASTLVGQYIDENGYRIRATRRVLTPLATQGRHHDILALFRQVNDKYFGGTVDALLTWGRAGSKRGRPRKTIKLGSYSAVERLIRIHPALDKPWVPRYFVAYIIYHEMLHHVIPSSHGPGRRMLHPPLFQSRERLFRDFDRSLAWERAHISRLLRT
jgi:hypothetical protein